MNFKGHFITEIIIMLILWGIFEQITVSMIIYPIFFGTLIPDADLRFKSHRNIIFHSIIPNIIIWYYIPIMENLLFIISIVIHLAGDLLPMIKKRGGYACIDLFNLARLNTKWSAVWLGVNILAGIFLFGMVI